VVVDQFIDAGVGNRCIDAEDDPRYAARWLVEVLIAGLCHS
jgi:hypothetical protein